MKIMITDFARRVFVASDEFVGCTLPCATFPQNRWIVLSPAALRLSKQSSFDAIANRCCAQGKTEVGVSRESPDESFGRENRHIGRGSVGRDIQHKSTDIIRRLQSVSFFRDRPVLRMEGGTLFSTDWRFQKIAQLSYAHASA